MEEEKDKAQEIEACASLPSPEEYQRLADGRRPEQVNVIIAELDSRIRMKFSRKFNGKNLYVSVNVQHYRKSVIELAMEAIQKSGWEAVLKSDCIVVSTSVKPKD